MVTTSRRHAVPVRYLSDTGLDAYGEEASPADSPREGALDLVQVLPAVDGARQRPGAHRQDGLDDRRRQGLRLAVYGRGGMMAARGYHLLICAMRASVQFVTEARQDTLSLRHM
jgi:hypothetical protein